MINTNNFHRPLTRLASFLSLSSLTLALIAPASAKDLAEVPLLKRVSPSMERDERTGVVVTGYAEMNNEWITAFRDHDRTGGKPGSVSLDLPGKSYRLNFTKFQKTGDERWAGLGTVEGEKPGSFSMACYKGVLSLELIEGDTRKVLKVNRHLAGRHKIIDVSGLKAPHDGNNQSYGPAEKERPTESLRENAVQTPPALAKASADSNVVHLGVVWSKEAAAGAGGVEPLLAEIDRQILEFNDILEKCGVTVRWQLVYTGEAANTDTMAVSSYNYFFDMGGGFSSVNLTDTMANFREFNSIDHLTLIRESEMPGAAGLGAFGSSILNRYYFQTGTTVAYHEWGHGMGAEHPRSDFTDGGEPNAFNYGFIHRNGNVLVWKTIMGNNLTNTIKYFSSPKLSYEGIPVGISAGTVDEVGNPISADNVRYFNETGGPRAVRNNALGLRVSVIRKNNPIPHGGYQNFIIRYGNTSNQLLTNVRVAAWAPISRNFSVIAISHGGVVEDTEVSWEVEDLGPGSPGNATFGKDSLILTVKINEGESYLDAINVYGYADGGVFFNSVSYYTRVDSTLSLGPIHSNNKLRPQLIHNIGKNTTITLSTSHGFDLYSVDGTMIWTYQGTGNPIDGSLLQIPESVTHRGWGYIDFHSAK